MTGDGRRETGDGGRRTGEGLGAGKVQRLGQAASHRSEDVVHKDDARAGAAANLDGAVVGFGSEVGDGEQDQAHVARPDEVGQVAHAAQHPASADAHTLLGGIVVHHADDGESLAERAARQEPADDLSALPRAEDERPFAKVAAAFAPIEPAVGDGGDQAQAVAQEETGKEGDNGAEDQHPVRERRERQPLPRRPGGVDQDQDEDREQIGHDERQSVFGGGARPVDPVEAEDKVDEAEQGRERERQEGQRQKPPIDDRENAPGRRDQNDRKEVDRQVQEKPGEVAPEDLVDGAGEEPAFGDAALPEERDEGQERPGQNVEVLEQGAVADVEQVETEFVGQDVAQVGVHDVVGGEQIFFAAVKHAGGTGDARADGKDLAAGLLGPGCDDLRVFGTGTNQAHLADQDVPELRQFVEFGVAQPPAQGGDPFVVFGGDARAGRAARVFVHRAELEDLEFHAIAADAPSAVEHRARPLPLKGGGDDAEDRQEQQQSERRSQHVDQAFGGVGNPSERGEGF